MKKTCLTLGSAAIASLMLAGCGTQLESLPIQPVASLTTQKAALSTDPASKIAVYFGAQKHPDVVRRVASASHSVRVARATDIFFTRCECSRGRESAL